MALLITTLSKGPAESVVIQARAAMDQGSDLVELRLDLLPNPQQCLEHFAEHFPPGLWVATNRSVAQGGAAGGPVEHRLPQLIAAARAGAGYVDVEYDDWVRSPLLRAEVASAAGDVHRGAGPRLILSHHDFHARPPNLLDLADRMAAVPEAAVIKLAWPADTILANFEAFELIRGCSKDAVALCLGEAGLLSRVLSGKFGAFASYCSPTGDAATAPGQLTLAEMVDVYRWSAITEQTELYGVIGSPVRHSIGPTIFNEVFASAKADAVYLPLLVGPDYPSFAGFLDACRSHASLNARGFSITIPHKAHARRYLGNNVEPAADRIGAVNTLRLENGNLWGCNTDAPAALQALLHALACEVNDLVGLPVDVLGAGGVAQAIVAVLADFRADITLWNRDPARAEDLAQRFGCRTQPWEHRGDLSGRVVINATSVGMWPDVDATPLPAGSLRRGVLVFDTIYRPARTRLLREAEAAGCHTVGGLDLYVRQAVEQFEFWRQQSADDSLFFDLAQRALDANRAS